MRFATPLTDDNDYDYDTFNSLARGQSCRIIYTSSKDDMLAAGDLIMCRYVLRTEGFDNAGALR